MLLLKYFLIVVTYYLLGLLIPRLSGSYFIFVLAGVKIEVLHPFFPLPVGATDDQGESQHTLLPLILLAWVLNIALKIVFSILFTGAIFFIIELFP